MKRASHDNHQRAHRKRTQRSSEPDRCGRCAIRGRRDRSVRGALPQKKTGGLDDTQLRRIEERLGYLSQLEDRRATVLKSISEQGKLTPDLKRAIANAASKVELEDLYTPFKPKRRTKAHIARESGLEPLALALLSNPSLNPSTEAAKYVDADKGVTDAASALDGARAILIERIGENAKLVGELREWLWSNGHLSSRVLKGKAGDGAKFSDYFDFAQAIRDIPSHRALALLRGSNVSILGLDLDVETQPDRPHPAELKIMSAFDIANRGRPPTAFYQRPSSKRGRPNCISRSRQTSSRG